MAGFGAAILALLLAWSYHVLVAGVPTRTFWPPRGTALVSAVMVLIAAPLLAWLLLRLLGLPHPLLTALLSVPLYLVHFVLLPLTGAPILQDPLWGRVLGLAVMSLAVALPALLTSRHHRLRAAQRGGAVPNTP